MICARIVGAQQCHVIRARARIVRWFQDSAHIGMLSSFACTWRQSSLHHTSSPGFARKPCIYFMAGWKVVDPCFATQLAIVVTVVAMCCLYSLGEHARLRLCVPNCAIVWRLGGYGPTVVGRVVVSLTIHLHLWWYCACDYEYDYVVIYGNNLGGAPFY